MTRGHAQVRPRMFPASAADRQTAAGHSPLVRRAADHRSIRQADLMWDDLSPACPRCSNLCGPDHFNCPACGSALYPQANSEAIAATARDTAIAPPISKG